jgi:small subunit ribosomal protein S1
MNIKNSENIKNSDAAFDANLISEQEKNFIAENFAELFEEFEKDTQKLIEGSVVKGVIVGITEKGVAVDIGAKSVGFIDKSEFKRDGEILEGNVIDVFLEKLENRKGELIISRDNARRYLNWHYLKNCLEDKAIIDGYVIGKVKGGYAVDVDGITCFLPRSQVDTMLLTDDSSLIGQTEKLQVLKIDEIRGNVVVSRRAILESQRNLEKDKVLSKIKVGDVLDGIIKNITDYGAFIDFGSFDGLLHLTDISWCRVRHPSEVLKVGQEVKVQVIKYDEGSKRVSLGMKQLHQNPWENISERYPVGSVVKGHVTNITTYGAFVEIEEGIEGLVHVSEMSWLKNNTSPNKFLSPNQEVEVMVLDINSQNHRISLGMKQCEKNPWQDFSEKHKVGDIIEGIVRNFTEFGLFVGFDNGVDGLVHVSDIANGSPEEVLKKFKKDEKIKVIVLGSNYEKERISLGIKQIDNKLFKDDLEKITDGSVVSSVVINIKKDFLEVELDSGLKAIIKRLDLSKNKQDQRTEKFEVGDRIEAKVILFNKITGKLLLSIKDLESEEHENHLYSENDSNSTSVGEILKESLAAASMNKSES